MFGFGGKRKQEPELEQERELSEDELYPTWPKKVVICTDCHPTNEFASGRCPRHKAKIEQWLSDQFNGRL